MVIHMYVDLQLVRVQGGCTPCSPQNLLRLEGQSCFTTNTAAASTGIARVHGGYWHLLLSSWLIHVEARFLGFSIWKLRFPHMVAGL